MNIFINLPHTLLCKIVGYLDDNIDKICFSLVCKRWFNDRDKYLSFNTDRIYALDRPSRFIMLLNSYKDIFNKSINNKAKQTLSISESYKTDRDIAITDLNELLKMNQFDSNVYKVFIQEDDFLDSEPYSDSVNDHIIEMVASSPFVTKLKGCQKLPISNCMPANLTSISFSYFNRELVVGCFPPVLRKLKLGNPFNQVIRVGVLPNTLEKLNFGSYFDQPIEPGVLPESLRSLKFESDYGQALKIGSLPAYLEKLTYSAVDIPISHGVLPVTLSTLKNAPVSWLNEISTLPKLRHLSLAADDPYIQAAPINLSQLPATLEKLAINRPAVLESALNPAITCLMLGNDVIYTFDEICKDKTKYNFKVLRVDALKLESLNGFQIETLDLYFPENAQDNMPIRAIPFGVESLLLKDDFIFKPAPFSKNDIPTSVKTIKVYNLNVFGSEGGMAIPESVKELEYENYEEGSYLGDILPSSLQTIICPLLELPWLPILFNNITFNIAKHIKLQARMIDSDYYLVFGMTASFDGRFIASIVHKYILSDLQYFDE